MDNTIQDLRQFLEDNKDKSFGTISRDKQYIELRLRLSKELRSALAHTFNQSLKKGISVGEFLDLIDGNLEELYQKNFKYPSYLKIVIQVLSQNHKSD